MEFKQFKGIMQDHVAVMLKNQDRLFEVGVDKDEMWDLYLDSFPVEFNKVFRERRAHDCSCCRQFVRAIGNMVVIKDNVIHTIWDFQTGSEEYQPSVDAMANYIRSKMVSDVYLTDFSKIGTDSNLEKMDSGNIVTWEHFYLELPNRFVTQSNDDTEGTIKGEFRAIRDVFKRSLDELTQDSVETVLELISSNTLYKGMEWKNQLEIFLAYKLTYDELSDAEKENYAWEQSVKVGAVIGKIRNHSIGTLLIDISGKVKEDGTIVNPIDLDTAVRKYEKMVAPENYKRPNAIYSKKMLEDAKATLEKEGLLGSLNRRHGQLSDITVNNILFCNRDSSKRVGGVDVFDEMSKSVPSNPKKFSRVEEVSVEDFIKNVLPTVKELEVFLENQHANSMVSLIAPEDMSAKSLMKWDNNFSWAYSGNITDSSMKENVKSAGGDVDGVLRASLQWNNKGKDVNDLDVHCIDPSGNKIYWRNKRDTATTAKLDIDVQNPISGKPAVENITWTDINRMRDGKYTFLVKNFSHRGGRSGFEFEIEFNGQIYSFDYNKELRNKEEVLVAEVTLKNGVFTIEEVLPSSTSSREVWGLNTNQFVPVSVAMFSPNYWDEQEGIGHKHLFLMMKDCVNPEEPNSFYNEFLKQDLMKHKKVLEALGGKMKVKKVENQLSGLGFSLSKKDEVVVKVIGQSERILKIKF